MIVESIFAVGKLAKGSLSFRVSANYLGGIMNFKNERSPSDAKYKN